MKLLIIDTETNGLDPTQHQVLEIGAILYDTRWGVLQQISTLLPHVKENEQQHINKIHIKACNEVIVDLLNPIINMGHVAEFVIAHNVKFDSQWFDDIKLPKLRAGSGDFLRWLCTYDDFDFPDQLKHGHSLTELALLHNVPVVSAHRALTDCQLIASIFDKLREREILDDIIATAAKPSFVAVAKVSYNEREKAKKAGFRWVSETKTWERTIREEQFDSFDFPVELKQVVF